MPFIYLINGICFNFQHWIANNLFGLAFAMSGVEFLQLNAVSTGCILLGGLFIYDVFWVRNSPHSAILYISTVENCYEDIRTLETIIFSKPICCE